MDGKIARNVAKVAEIPLQLRRAKDSLSKLQAQLAKTRKSVTVLVEKNGVDNSKKEMEALKELEKQVRAQRKEVNSLQKSLSASANSSRGMLVILCLPTM